MILYKDNLTIEKRLEQIIYSIQFTIQEIRTKINQSILYLKIIDYFKENDFKRKKRHLNTLIHELKGFDSNR